MLRNHDLNLLPVFAMLMQEKHLSRAAERLGMSQPAVSNALKRLRHEYKDELFVRTGRGLSPTQRAQDLHARIGPALGSIRDSYAEQSPSGDTYLRTVDMSMNQAVENMWGAVLMRDARQKAPGITWRLHGDYIDEIPSRLKDGRLNFAVEYTPLPSEHFSSTVLLKEGLKLICAADHPKIDGHITLDDFKTLPHVSLVRRFGLVRAQNSRRTTPLELMLGPMMPQRRVELYMSSFVSIPAVVAETDLLAVVPSRLALPLADAGLIQALSLPFEAPEIELRLF